MNPPRFHRKVWPYPNLPSIHAVRGVQSKAVSGGFNFWWDLIGFPRDCDCGADIVQYTIYISLNPSVSWCLCHMAISVMSVQRDDGFLLDIILLVGPTMRLQEEHYWGTLLYNI